MKQFFCELLFICAAAAPTAKPVDELTYGTVLYDYYQQDYQGALLNTLIADAQQRRGDNPVRFELAAGSFAFADGMYDYSSQLFNAIAEQELTDLDRMRLAFHLSREYHRRQDWSKLDAQLAQIELGETWRGRARLHPEVEFMRAELAIQQGQYDQAQDFLATLEEQHPLRAYGLFNLGVAQHKAGQLDPAKQTFTSLAQMPVYDEEAYDLSQRAKLALAFIARKQADTPTAENVLSNLPGEGRYQEVAMAAFGGLAMDNEDYPLAARIWMTLQEDAYWTPSTATARLGFPMSLERMATQQQGATTEMALLQYQRAEQSFTQRLLDLQDLTQQATDPTWVHGLLHVFSRPEQQPEQMGEFMQRWQQQLGHTDWLEWLATDQVHQALVQWRELNQMENWLTQLPDHLAALDEVAIEQRDRGIRARSMLQDDGLLSQRDQLDAGIHRLEQRLRSVEQSDPQPDPAWMMPLATPDERALIAELQDMQDLLPHMAAVDRNKWAKRIRRLMGVVFYQIVESGAARVQSLRAERKSLSTLLAEADERIARLDGAEAQFMAGVGTDFLAFNQRAQQITAQVEQARATRETMLAGEIRARLQEEMQQVQQYLLVTRIAIARATDQLALNADGAPPS